MRDLRLTLMSLIPILLITVCADAAPGTFKLHRTSDILNVDPPEAPLPLGRVQYYAGDVLDSNDTKVGEYLVVNVVHSGTMNTAAVTLTLFFPPTSESQNAPSVITLQGSHDYSSGDEVGSVSASTFGNVGVRFAFDGTTNLLKLLIP